MGSLGVSGSFVYEHFSVVNESNTLIESIPISAFSIDLFEPNGVESNINVDIIELGNGHYKTIFIPDKVGTWYLIVYHDTYFPWGKAGEIEVYSSDFTNIQEDVSQILGLVHSNIFIDNPEYDNNNNLISARIRIYSNSISVGTNNNVIGEYQITAPSSGPGKFITWKQIKI